jgi:hypothetical protein
LRDSLTALAALVILVFVAALAIPPFVDWEERRLDLEAALSGAAGVPVETRGDIDLRLLPSPRLRVDGLTIGVPDGNAPSVVAQGVVAEMELTALLSGQIRFRSIAIGQADLRLPMVDGALSLPALTRDGTDALGALALDDLAITSLSVTTITPELGAMRRALLANLRLGAPSLAGPWRVEGVYAGDRFRLSAGRLDETLSMQLRLVGGADAPLRYDIDGRLQFVPESAGMRPDLSGEGRLSLLPPDSSETVALEPLVLSGAFASEGAGFALSDLRVELGDPALGSQLEGEGFLRLDDPRISLDLAGRRLALDAILAGPRGGLFMDWLSASGPGAGLPPVDLSLALGSVGYAREELLDVALRAILEDGVLQVLRGAISLPGEARLSYAGDIDLSRLDRFSGDVTLTAENSERLARYLPRLGLDGPWIGLLSGPPVDVTGHVTLDEQGFRVSRLAFQAGESLIQGDLVYRAPEIGRRGRVEADIRADGIDLGDLPPLDAFTQAAADADLVVAVSADDVRYGEETGGRIRARLRSEGETIVVDALEISGLAGAQAEVSGRITPDGAGLITGRLQARRAAPLLTLIGRFQQDGLLAMTPGFVRNGALDLMLSIDRLPPERGLDAGALRMTLEGDVAGGPFSATASTLGGRIEEFELLLSTRDTRDWVDLDHEAITGRPSTVSAQMRRSGPDRYAGSISGEMAGLRFRTTRALSIDAITREIWDGEVHLATADIRPAVALFMLGDAGLDAMDGQMRVSLSREPGASRLDLDGRIGGETLRGRLLLPGEGGVSGALQTSRLTLPAMIDILLTNTGAAAIAGEGWSDEPFRPVSLNLRRGEITIEADVIALGRGLALADGRLDLAPLSDGLALRNLEGRLGTGRIGGDVSLRLSPEGRLAVVGDVDFSGLSSNLFGASPDFEAVLTGALDFGGSGSSPAALVADLSGGGTLLLEDIEIARMAPGAITGGLESALQEDDPLGGRTLLGYVERALDAGAFRYPLAQAPTTIVGGALRMEPLRLGDPALGEESWSGVLAIDLATGSLDMRGVMRASEGPSGWTGAPPQIDLGWTGSWEAPRRVVDVGPLTNGVAQIVLQRELDRIEAFEREAGERTRRLEQLRMERAREEARLRFEAILEERAREAAARREAAIEAAQAEARARQAETEAAREAERLAQEAEEAARRAAEEEAARLEEERLQALEAERRAEEEDQRELRDEIRRLLEREQLRLPGFPGMVQEPDDRNDPPLRLSPPGFSDPGAPPR